MKKEIHPEYFENAKITCACGAVYETGSTASEIQVELCANCHPFYTGTQKIVDSARRVEKFLAKKEKAEKSNAKGGKKAKQAKRKAKKEAKKEEN